VFCTLDAYTRMTPQILNGQPALRHAAIAIGAMRLAIGSSALPDTVLDHPEELSQTPQYRDALNFYVQAIYEIRTASNSSTDSGMRDAILCSALFTCFESLQGRLKAALNHIHLGVRIINYLLERYGYEDFTTLCQRPLPPGLPLDKEIFLMYRMLDSQAWNWISFNPWPGSLSQWKESASTLWSCERPPATFISLEEAREWLHVADNVFHHYSRARLVSLMHTTDDADAMCADEEIRDRLRVECLSHLTLWYQAFQPLYAEAMKLPASSETFLQASAMRAGYLCAYISTHCPLMDNVYSDREILCGELVQLAKVQIESDLEPFKMDSGVVRDLNVALLTTEDPALRLEVVRLLEEVPRRDCLWDSRASLNLGVRCAEVDESQLAPNSPYVVSVRGYKQDFLSGQWRYIETALRLLDKEPCQDDGWDNTEAEPNRGRRRIFVGIQLQPLTPSAGRWVLYEPDAES
jgi:hypothetical protein